jgi:hypothetical protein
MSQVKISMGGKLHNPGAIGYNFSTGRTNHGLGGDPMGPLFRTSGSQGFKPTQKNNRTTYKWVTLPDGRRIRARAFADEQRQGQGQTGHGQRQKQPIKMWHGGWEWM